MGLAPDLALCNAVVKIYVFEHADGHSSLRSSSLSGLHTGSRHRQECPSPTLNYPILP